MENTGLCQKPISPFTQIIVLSDTININNVSLLDSRYLFRVNIIFSNTSSKI